MFRNELPIDQTYCFAPDTLVVTSDGFRQIDSFSVGDELLAFDHTQGKWVVDHIAKRHDSLYDGPVVTLTTEQGTVECTVYHPFWVVEGRDLDDRPQCRELKDREDEGPLLLGRWVNSHDLRPGDKLYNASGQICTLLRTEQRYELNFRVVNLTITKGHTFAVGKDALLVHNTANCDLLRAALGDNPHPVKAQAHHSIDLNGADNGVWLPEHTYEGWGGATHRGGHTRDYYQRVEDALNRAQSREDALSTLSDLKAQLNNGTLLPHRL